MNISRQPDGHDATGQPQFVWQLESEQLKVVVSEYGVRLMAVYVRDKNHVQRNVVLGLASTEDYRQDTASLGAVVGRFANRIRDARYDNGGQEVCLDKNHGLHHLHVGELGFEDVLWQAAATTTGVCFTYRSVDGEQGYPGDLDVSVTLNLMGDSLGYHYQAISNRDTIINLTNHAYFNLNPKGKINTQYLCIHADEVLELKSTLVPNGIKKSVKETQFDFKEQKQINNTRLDDYFVLQNDSKEAAVLFSQETGIEMKTVTNQPGLVVFTPPHFEAICFETQKFSNTPNISKFPSTLIKAGELYNQKTHYTFSLKTV